ncbi:hypothetical protein IEQ34_009493 [Dendrobium chrysotoxum]|uniref:Uncharacterized protein n=1 Tax=Dendrobium chrysotoxum TaxID=161865 RepID=A0AAV7H310_DENCH|nr:hypothetical protein IEQ34_009493 [Dendrobium chrysotoxum]
MALEVLELFAVKVIEDDMDGQNAALDFRAKTNDTANGGIGYGEDGDGVAMIDLFREVGG